MWNLGQNIFEALPVGIPPVKLLNNNHVVDYYNKFVVCSDWKFFA